MRFLKRWIAVVLTICMICNMLPMSGSAEDGAEEQKMTAYDAEDGQDDIEGKTEPVDMQSENISSEDSENIQPEEVEEEQVVFELRLLSEETTEGVYSNSFANQFSKVLEENNFKPSALISEDNNGIVTLTIPQGHAGILELLSQQIQTAESNYQNWNIAFSFTGNMTLSDAFKGLGDEGFPFQGKFTNQGITIQSSQTIFKELGAAADLHGVKIIWTGKPDIPILTRRLIADDGAHVIQMPVSSTQYFSPYIGQLTGGSGLVTLPSLDYSEAIEYPEQEKNPYDGDAGLVCGSMDKNTKLKVAQLTLPDGDKKVYLSASGNAGGLIGCMGENTELLLSQNLTLTTKLSGKNAGGLVGSIEYGSIDFADGCYAEITTELTAAESAGGIAGSISTTAGPLGTGADVILQSVKANGTMNSGVYYGSCTVTGTFDPLTGVSFAESAVREVSGPGSCGGVFGTLSLEGEGRCSFGTSEGDAVEISSSLTSAANTTCFGGAAGTMKGEAAKNVFVAEKCNVISSISVGNDNTKYPQYVGGIVGIQDTATVDVKNGTITVNAPKTYRASDYGFGGLAAKVGDGALLIADAMTVKTDSYSANLGGGGVAGSAGKTSVVFLKTSLDLSECPLSANATSGQIVGSQDCSLIYAPDVAITRLQTRSWNGMELDDIGNYGEMYRLKNFLTVNDDYTISFSNILQQTDGAYTLSNERDYACLALAWQSRGNFLTVGGINKTNWDNLKSCTINLGRDLDLTGCGIGGLTRDVNSDDDTFSGTFIGGGHTITLDIGADNQANSTKVPKGDGRIYWHAATGLFAVLSSGAEVKNLVLGGSIRVSNSQLRTSNTIPSMKSGGLAALVNSKKDNESAIKIDNVSTTVSFDAVCNGDNPLYIGGLVGLISDTQGKTPELYLGAEAALAACVDTAHSGDGNYNHIGGGIGAVDTNAGVNITCDGAKLGGNIEYQGSPKNIYAGGLVGTILPKKSGNNSITRTITLKSLNVRNFSFTGSASDRMGGILGGIWADTDVKIAGLSVEKAELNANGTAALGGLVYRAGGKWTVSSVDLNGLTIHASSAKALGVLVCQGGPYKEPINTTTTTYTNIGGLYLEMTEYWDWSDETKKGYNVPSDILFGGKAFDEFVVYTAYADRSSDTPDYQITENGSGIISLKTSNDTVNMTEGERNTYVNRTTVGQSKQTNLYSRYYYNLPEVKEQCQGGDVDTPQEFLIWSVYRYADSGLKSNFEFEGVDTLTIGGTSATDKASFDMKGLSYYPINITNANITVQNVDVRFYNTEIETKEAGNKLTRGSDTEHSQHYTMHCGLFLNYTADLTKTSVYANRTMTVNGVTFAGSVGVINGGSGALLCGTVKGDTKEGNSSACTVILADDDNEIKSVSLNGITVSPVGDYTPVLINKFGSYAGLKANYVTTTAKQTTTAGSSLIGDVGGQGATGISVEFEGTVKLPETGVFTKATLLNSLRYENGSATYRFYKSKDYNGDEYIHNATHGSELTTTVEYVGKQGCYYDGYGEGYYISKHSSFNSLNDFSKCLPYVALSPAASEATHPLGEGWHELAVNVLSIDLTEGCGTYGHPYQVDSNHLEEIANYINTGIASDGWQVRVSAATETYHTVGGDGNDVILTYSSSDGWKEGNESYQGNVQQYLSSAYYEIEDSMELSNFNGIGTDGSGQGLPFTGVITGKKNGDGDVPTVTLSGGSTAFVKYSYGSVVRDLNIVLNQNISLLWESQQNSSTRTAEQAPKNFFGGVIGCVLGGDNIIENITVNSGNECQVNAAGDKSYLVPVGGYIGVISGGGVILRGNCSSVTGIKGEDAELYKNPIIGRVLGGYAFYEGSDKAPDNGDKNYKINSINYNDIDLSWDGSNLTVNNAQGLLILSAIVSSGAGSTSSNAYAKGKARNAAYDQIGAAEEPEDYSTAKTDAGEVWNNGNTPYLLSKYAGYTGSAGICSSSTDGIAVKFAENAVFNMTDYGNGYRGLSARYVSNAAFSTSGGVDASTVVMRVSSFDGQNADVQNINMNVQEYADDDFHAASLGGIFNIVWTKKQSGGKNAESIFAQDLTLTNCMVSLKYINENGDEQIQADTGTFADEDGLSCVTVGGFIGSVSDVEADSTSSIDFNRVHNYLFSNLSIQGNSGDGRCKITGPNSAGGLIGASAMTSSIVQGYPGKLLSNSNNALFGPGFLNCSYSNVDITAKLAAGGLAGYVYAFNWNGKPQFSGFGLPYKSGNTYFLCYASSTVTKENFTVGSNSTICAGAKRGVSGGIFGAAGMRVGINDPDVNSRAGQTVVKSGESIQKLQLNNVTIKSSLENKNIFQGSGDKNGPENNTDNTAAAGIVGRIGNVNPTYFYDISMQKCTIESPFDYANSYTGGIVGYGYTNTSMTILRCEIKETSIKGKYAGGFVGYGHSSSGYTLNMSDCKMKDSTVQGTSYSGGIVGSASSKYYLFNILIKNTSITVTKGTNAGRLFGWMNINDNSDNFRVYAAGISVYADREDVTIPSQDGNTTSGRKYIGYISYADYAGMETEVEGEKDPYVTVNPNYRLTTDKLLTGDAVGQIADDAYHSVAARIWADQKTGASGKKNLVSYQNAAAIVNAEGKSEPTVYTFNIEQGCGPDLPVLVLEDSDASIIEDYLNVITNGGYEVSGVNLKDPVVYYYDQEKDSFAEATSEQLKKEPGSIYLSSGVPRVRNRQYDNGRNRFTLLEADFTVNVNGTSRIYTVSIPVIVKRELQYNFISTFSYGAEFSASTYDGLKTHILESTDNPITAYLTYQYNREKTEYVEYDWQGYMDGGGNMMGVDKVLSFSSGLPSGTQLLLVDCQDGNRAFKYVTKGASSGTKTEIRLSDFTSVTDDTFGFRSSMADILGVTVSQNNTSGKYVEETNVSKAMVRRNNVYYRLVGETETVPEGTNRYDLTVPDLEKQPSPPAENYYLVVNVPSQSDPDFYLNGALSSSLNWEMPSKGTWVHRYDNTSICTGNNDESTYQISSGYSQSLTPDSVEAAIDLSSESRTMKVQFQDEITFSNRQVYDKNDQLFLKFTVGLQEHTVQEGTSKIVQGLGFPAGTSGKVHFFVQDDEGNYYTYNGNSWVKKGNTEAEAVSYTWVSQGDEMELILSEDGEHALDLSGVRTLIKGKSEDGESHIWIRAEMDVVFSGQETLMEVVPPSENAGIDRWVQMHYTGRLSTQESSLSYSTVTSSVDDRAKYYRGVQYAAILSMDARNISQLGINPLELVPEYLSFGQKASRIDIMASLNLSKLASSENIKELLKNTNRIDLTLSLQKGGRGGYSETLTNGSDYITFDTGISWSIQQSEYYDSTSDRLITTASFNGTEFTIPITAYVNVKQKDYANYRIKLEVTFNGTSNKTISVTDTDAYLVYTYACIKPEFFDPSNQ